MIELNVDPSPYVDNFLIAFLMNDDVTDMDFMKRNRDWIKAVYERPPPVTALARR